MAERAQGRGIGRAWAVPIALFVLALVLRLVYLRQAAADPQYHNLSAIWDSLYYHNHGLAIAGVQPELDPVRGLPYFLGPLYSYFVGALYWAVAPEPEVVKTAQAVVGALSCALVYGIGRNVFSERVGVVAALLLCGYGHAIYQTQILLPGTLVLFVNLLFVYAVTSGPPSGRRWLVGGVVVGLAVAAKTNALLLVPAALVVLWAVPPVPMQRRAKVRGSAALVLGAALAIAPFTARNWVASDHFVLVNTSGGRNLWKGNGPAANGTHVGLASHFAVESDDPPDARDRGTNLADYLDGKADLEEVVAESGHFTRRTVTYVAGRPVRSAGLFAKKLGLLFNSVELANRDRFYFARQYSSLLRLPLPSFGFIATLGLAGLALAWRDNRRVPMLYAVLAVQVASFVAVFVLGRYRLVLAALLCLFGAWLLTRWFDAARARAWRTVAPSVAAAAVAAALVHLPFDGFGRDRDVGYAWLDLGRYLLTRGEYRAAVDAFESAERHDWGEAGDMPVLTARFQAARAWHGLGDDDRARSILAQLKRDLEADRPGGAKLRGAVDQLSRQIDGR